MPWSKKVDPRGNHGATGQRQTGMIRSRRLALVAIVVAFGISACGDPTTTAPLANQPKVIELANGRFTRSGGAAPTAAGTASVDSKMAVFAPTQFTYEGDLPALDGPAGSWYLPPGQQPDPDRITSLAASLGVEGDVRTLPDEQGGGWAVGPADYSGPVLTVVADGTLNWWLSTAPNATVGVACAGTAVIVPVAGTGSAGSSGAAIDPATPNESIPTETAPAPRLRLTALLRIAPHRNRRRVYLRRKRHLPRRRTCSPPGVTTSAPTSSTMCTPMNGTPASMPRCCSTV